MLGFVRFVLAASLLSSFFLTWLCSLFGDREGLLLFMNNDTSNLLGANNFLPGFEAPRKFVSVALGLAA